MHYRDPHSFSATDQGSIQHIDFRMEVFFDRRIIQAQAIYSFDSSVQGPLFLDTRDLDIKRIHAGGREIEWVDYT
jgi:aminopeptidase N